MPKVSAWLIRLSLLHLLSGAVLGTAFLLFKAQNWFHFSVTHLAVHIEQMLVGWMIQLVIGVGYWILPRQPDQSRDDGAVLLWVVFALLNAGVLCAALGTAPGWPPVLLLAGRLAETLAALLFASHAWRRQRAYRATTRRVLV